MNGKLNLSIDEHLKKRIKEYAAVRNLSLSVLVESYFRSLLYSPETGVQTPLTDSLVGILAAEPEEDLKDVRLKHLEKKYLYE